MGREDSLDVVLGPWSGLHSGAHASLLATPPAGVRYRLPQCGRSFTFSTPNGATNSPLSDFAIDEAVWFDGIDDSDLVHLHHLPLAGSTPFVVETDDLLATLMVGRFLPFGGTARIRLEDLDADLVRRRQQTLLQRFCSPQCAAIIFWTSAARTRALRYASVNGLAGPDVFAALETKSLVIHPTVAAAPRRPKPERPRVLFSGRSTDKGGDVALAAFAQAAEILDDEADFVYVGEIPSTADVHSSIRVISLRNRSSYLAELDAAHIFVSPTEFESYGMALVEAAAHGLALVTTRGPGMEHIEELFAADRNAFYLETVWPFERRVREVTEHILRLVRDPPLLAQAMEQNRALVEGGALSLRRRDRALSRAYEACTSVPTDAVSTRRPTESFDERWCHAALAEAIGQRYVRLRL